MRQARNNIAVILSALVDPSWVHAIHKARQWNVAPQLDCFWILTSHCYNQSVYLDYISTYLYRSITMMIVMLPYAFVHSFSPSFSVSSTLSAAEWPSHQADPYHHMSWVHGSCVISHKICHCDTSAQETNSFMKHFFYIRYVGNIPLLNSA